MEATVTVIGAGRMGKIIARQLPEETRKIIIDQKLQRAEELASAIDGIASTDIGAAQEADLFFIVVPASEVNAVVEQICRVARKGAVIVNMATSVNINEQTKNDKHFLNFVEGKIIGQASAMEQGEPGILVVDTVDRAIYRLIKSQLPMFKGICQGNPDLVPYINTVAVNAGLRAAVQASQELTLKGIPEDWLKTALKTICAGTVKAYAEDDLGPFARELANKLTENNSNR